MSIQGSIAPPPPPPALPLAAGLPTDGEEVAPLLLEELLLLEEELLDELELDELEELEELLLLEEELELDDEEESLTTALLLNTEPPALDTRTV